MDSDPRPIVVTAPRIAPQSPPAGFPLVAALAPVLIAVVLWMVTRSLYSLAFAAFGPVLAVAGAVDGRRQRRRAHRRSVIDGLADVEVLERRIEQGLREERVRLAAIRPSAAAISAGEGRLWESAERDAPPVVCLGRAALTGMVVIDEPPGARPPPELVAALDVLRESTDSAADIPILIDPRAGVEVIGPDHLARALARGLVLQLAATLPPEIWSAECWSSECWSAEGREGDGAEGERALWRGLPHAIREPSPRDPGVVGGEFRFLAAGTDPIRITWGHPSPGGAGTTITVTARGATLTRGDPPATVSLAAELISAAEASAGAARLHTAAVSAGRLPFERSLPENVAWGALHDASPHDPPRGTLIATIGGDAAGQVNLDLVSDGPHALIAGTTGSGKSELLISWVLSLAERHSPEQVTFLLIDFKGGASFAPLDGLRHVVGTITDLDQRTAARAIGSLRAELRHRERWLADRGARSIDDPGAERLPRLVVVVDEFAALVSDYPELHELVADLSARGRSLGLHLILCAQRPAGVVRDAVLANAGLRICLRVTSREDSSTVVGDDSAAALPAHPRGRAVVQASGTRRVVQLAHSSAVDAGRVIQGSLSHASPRRPWVEPPPADVRYGEVASATGGVGGDGGAGGAGRPLGLLDLPDQQRIEIGQWLPEADGHLLIVGGPGSGATTALAVIHAGMAADALPDAGPPDGRLPDSGLPDVWMPPDPADAWSMLDELDRRPPEGRLVLLIDDLDLLLDRAGDDRAGALAATLASMMRSTTGLRVAASTRRLPVSTLAACFPSRLLLGFPSRDQHVMSGGNGGDWVPGRRAGSGVWRGAELQIASDPVPPRPTMPRIERVDPSAALADAPVAIVTTRVSELLDLFGAAGVSAVDVESVVGANLSSGAVTIGDPDAWQTAWALLGEARRIPNLLVERCTAAELRALTRVRDAPPLRAGTASEAWRVRGRDATRVAVDWPRSPADQASAEANSR